MSCASIIFAILALCYEHFHFVWTSDCHTEITGMGLFFASPWMEISGPKLSSTAITKYICIQFCCLLSKWIHAVFSIKQIYKIPQNKNSCPVSTVSLCTLDHFSNQNRGLGQVLHSSVIYTSLSHPVHTSMYACIHIYIFQLYVWFKEAEGIWRNARGCCSLKISPWRT